MNDTTSEQNPSASTARARQYVAAGREDIRLIQAYLRAMGELGDPREVRGIDVVNGQFNARTAQACERFMAQRQSACNLSTPQRVEDVIATLRAANAELQQPRGPDQDLRTRQSLDQAFAEHPIHTRYPALARIHPHMRFALAAAMDDLAQRGVPVTIREGYREPAAQEAHVRKGRSTAVPYWSLHNYGLAVDIMPRNVSAEQAFDAKAPAWKAIISTMQRYGFYSLHASQGWDLPHFEIPALTADVVGWPQGTDGYKVIPYAALPEVWRTINQRALVARPQQKTRGSGAVER